MWCAPWPAVPISSSGDVWNYGDPQEDNCIQGSAVAFAQVVTQTRNVVDTNLQVVGDNANLWMTNALLSGIGVSSHYSLNGSHQF